MNVCRTVAGEWPFGENRVILLRHGLVERRTGHAGAQFDPLWVIAFRSEGVFYIGWTRQAHV